MDSNSQNGTIYILAAGTCWGFIGFFAKHLYSAGITTYQAAFYRMFFSTIVLSLLLLVKGPSLFKIKKTILLMAALIGFVCQALFNYYYFKSIEYNSISAAVILLYTAPVFAAVTAKFVHGESFTTRKMVSIAFCLTGCFLAVTGGHFTLAGLNLSGIAFGILSAITYSMFAILSRNISSDNNPLTLAFYSMLFGTALFFPIAQSSGTLVFEASAESISYLFLLALFSTVFPYVFYYTGMGKGVEASKAGVFSSVEVAVAVMLSITFFGEKLQPLQFTGILLVFLSIYILQSRKNILFHR